MKILVVNDDGIDAPGLKILTQWAVMLGDVTVCAPTQQQSGQSHAIKIHQPFKVVPTTLGLGEKEAYAVASTPVDCVRFATLGMNRTYDIVLSGINRGFNIGEDILYSGTVGAVFEAALQHMRGIAFSTQPKSFLDAKENLDKIYRYIQEKRLLEQNLAYNVNVPPAPKGILQTHQGGPYFSDMWVRMEDDTWQQEGYCVHENKHDLSLDTDATIDGYITITPLTTDRSKR